MKHGTKQQNEETRETWAEVLSTLSGLRLKVYDDVVRAGAASYTWPAHGIAYHEAAEWLVERRLIALDPHTGKWRAVPVREAMEAYESHGKADLETTPRPRKEETPPVQPHQAQFFDMEGYRANA